MTCKKSRILFFAAFWFFFFLSSSPLIAANTDDDPRIDSSVLKQVQFLIASKQDLPALQTLQEYRKHITQSELVHLVDFWMALIHFESRNFNQAITLFESLHKAAFSLRDYATFYLAKACNETGQTSRAFALLSTINNKNRPLDKEVFWTQIDTLISLKEWDKADVLLKQNSDWIKKNKSEVHKSLFYQVRLDWQRGNKKEAFGKARHMLIAHAGSFYDGPLFKIVNEADSQLDTGDFLARAHTLIQKGYPLKARFIYEQLTLAGKQDLKKEIAYATFKARRYQEASRLYEKILKTNLSQAEKLEILSYLSTSYSRSDQFDKSLKLIDYIVKTYPSTSLARQMQNKIPFITFDSGQYDKAFGLYFEKKQNDHLNHVRDQWYFFWSAYLTKNFTTALNYLDELKSKSRSSEDIRLYNYWIARCQEQLGQKDQAVKIYYQLSTTGKTPDYYAFLAKEKLHSKNLHPTQVVLERTIKTMPIREIHSLKVGPFRIPLDDPLYGAFLLAQIGLDHHAIAESNSSIFLKKTTDIGPQIYYLAGSNNYPRLHALGSFRIKKGLALNDQKTWLMAYPKAFEPWVSLHATSQNLSPFLVWALIKQESAFKPQAVSPAMAHGLMQMIPATAHDMAREANLATFELKDLYEPATSINLGALYLSARLRQFKGNLPYTLASYNAGPEAVERWRRWGHKLEPDEFIELIPYNETRDYVKKVLTNFWIYTKLYGSSPDNHSRFPSQKGQ